MSRVRILEKPIFARALMGSLALDDMGTHEFDTAMDELTEQLRLETQEEVCEIGEVRGLAREFGRAVGWQCERAGVRSDGVVKRVKDTSHVDDQVLQFVDAQVLDNKVGFAR